MSAPWYTKGETGEYLRDWADTLVHGHQAPADWLGLAKKAKKAGLTDSEVNEFLRSEDTGDCVSECESYYQSF